MFGVGDPIHTVLQMSKRMLKNGQAKQPGNPMVIIIHPDLFIFSSGGVTTYSMDVIHELEPEPVLPPVPLGDTDDSFIFYAVFTIVFLFQVLRR